MGRWWKRVDQQEAKKVVLKGLQEIKVEKQVSNCCLMFSHNVGGHDGPTPVYIVSPPAYVAPPDYNNLESGDRYLVAGSGSTSQERRKEQLPPSYQQLFPSSTLPTWLPPIEIVPTHPLQPPEIQQHVPYG